MLSSITSTSDSKRSSLMGMVGGMMGSNPREPEVRLVFFQLRRVSNMARGAMFASPVR